MKSQQRPFVVEIKSKRRSVGQPKSIWGNTDFKTLVRQAEEDAPHLFTKAEIEDGARAHTKSQELPAATPVIAGIADERDGRLSHQPSVAAEADQETASDVVVARSTALAVGRAKRRRRRTSQAISASPAHLETPSQAPDTEADDQDELAVLSKDNERLKRLWRARLIQENTWLRCTLDRFDDDISGRIKLGAIA